MNSIPAPNRSTVVFGLGSLSAVWFRSRVPLRALAFIACALGLLMSQTAVASGEEPPPPPVECVLDQDCGACGTCSSGICSISVNFECDANKPCPSGDFCAVSVCASSCEAVQCPPEVLECPEGYEPTDTTADGCADTCTESLGPCGDFLPSCTSNSDCPDSHVCDITGCKDTCFCDEESGQVICLPDCGSGVCVLQDEDDVCPAPQIDGNLNCPSANVWAQNPVNGDCCEYASSCEAPNGWPLAYSGMQCLLMAPLDPCEKDSDCNHCFATCEQGYCQAPETNEPQCEADADCEAGEYCHTAWCGGSCFDIDPDKSEEEEEEEELPACVDDSDCGECFPFCFEGSCVITGFLECEIDADCGPGYACDTTICGGTCVETGPNEWPTEEAECVEDLDCGECGGVCLDGLCTPTGAIECETDADCGEGYACDTLLCGGTCVDANSRKGGQQEEPPCSVDADCGACFEACVDGACVATGAVECEADSECSEGAVCDLAQCGGTCVDKGSSPTSTTPGQVEAESASGTTADGCSSSAPGHGLPLALWVTISLLVVAHRRQRSTSVPSANSGG